MGIIEHIRIAIDDSSNSAPNDVRSVVLPAKDGTIINQQKKIPEK